MTESEEQAEIADMEPKPVLLDTVMRERIDLARRAHAGVLLADSLEQQRRVEIAKRAHRLGLRGLLINSFN